MSDNSASCTSSSSVPNPISLPPSSKPQSLANQRRRTRRLRFKELHGHPPTRESIESIVHEAIVHHNHFATAETAHVRGAFTGKCERFSTKALRQVHREEMSRARSVEELVSQGFQYIKWEGCSVYAVDRNNIVFAVIAAPPSKPDYSLAAERVFQHIMLLSQRLPVPAAHRRGTFPAINLGVHRGIGLQQPANLRLNGRECEIAEELLQDPDFQRLCTFQSGENWRCFYSPQCKPLQRHFRCGFLSSMQSTNPPCKPSNRRSRHSASLFPKALFLASPSTSAAASQHTGIETSII